MHLSDEARRLALRCEPRVDELARQMSRDAFERLPGYTSMPDDMKDREIAATAKHGLRLFMRRVRSPHVRHTGGSLFRERAAQRAEEEVPLHLLLRTHSLGVHVLWQALREAAHPGEEAALAELTDLLLRMQESTIGAVTETYMDERAAMDAETREHHRWLVRSLLEGTPGTSVSELGFDPDGPCLVLAMTVPLPDESTNVAARRAWRRVRTVLDHAFGVEVPTLFPAAGHEWQDEATLGYALVSGSAEPSEATISRLHRALGDRLRVAAVRADHPNGVAEAARTAVEVLDVARSHALAPGLHRLNDVLLEYHLSRADASSAAIAALLDPLADRPELVETFRVYLEQDRDRRDSARALFVHPNTVDNRLSQCRALTGLDLSSPRGAALALAALSLRDDLGNRAHPRRRF